jgi:hypothetical protein
MFLMELASSLVPDEDKTNPTRIRIDPVQYPYGFFLLNNIGLTDENTELLLSSDSFNEIRTRCYEKLH